MNNTSICTIVFALLAIVIITVQNYQFQDLEIYEVKTRLPIKFELVDQLKFRKTLYYLGRSNGCTCQDLTCGCCAGVNITQFNFDREGCMNFTYSPCKFDVTMNMLWNEESVYTNKFSAQNPPPLCMPIPIPYVPQAQVDFCVKMFNIHMPGQNLNMCMDMEMRVQKQRLVVLHFNCMRFGQDGIALTRPDSECPLSSSESNEEDSTSQPAADIFDPVTETRL
ncbi:uncharacterized protein LOC123303079 [Chrysoperla carnea]|uniref:uncharacterized protein LOC123303079 n=1 Tax=Chrysoperla carnea TaxID=189513 RepID=UPI001D087A8D|nr:uncharacterized protein LOC123303079 [Chrysoperla carnea]